VPVQPARPGLPHRPRSTRATTFGDGDVRRTCPGSRPRHGRPTRPWSTCSAASPRQGRHTRPDRAGLAARAAAVDRPHPRHPPPASGSRRTSAPCRST
jgi:hypothetical protein